MSDHTIFVKERGTAYLGGPPLVKMAIDEEVDEETLGGAEMHSTVSGLSDHLAVDELDAIRIARDLVAHLRWRKLGPGPSEPADEPVHDPAELIGAASADVRVPFEVREILARVLDGSRFEEFKPLYGDKLVCGWGSICGFPVGVLANNGILFSEESNKGAQFIQLCNRSDTPLVFVQNITGFMVGSAAERGGIIKNGAKLINAVSNSEVPHLVLMVGASYGAGNYGMSGRAYDPRVHLHLAQPPHRRDGPQAARRRHGHHRPQRRRRPGPGGRRGRPRRPDQGPRGPGRGPVHRPVRHGPALGRRHHPPGRLPHRPRHRPVGHPLGRGARRHHLRRLAALTHAFLPPFRRPTAPNCLQEQRPLGSCRPFGALGRRSAHKNGEGGGVIRRLLIANRGEIAVRVARTAHRMGIDTVGVFSEPDADALHVEVVDVAVALGGSSPAESYLRIDALVQAALDTGCDAVHPGYGFLAERADFARAVVDAGLVWVGPTPEQIDLLGDKIAAKRAAIQAGVHTTDAVEVAPGNIPDDLPVPALVKAAAGGGRAGHAHRSHPG
jgi:hypothetical protein